MAEVLVIVASVVVAMPKNFHVCISKVSGFKLVFVVLLIGTIIWGGMLYHTLQEYQSMIEEIPDWLRKYWNYVPFSWSSCSTSLLEPAEVLKAAEVDGNYFCKGV
ncbi:MAG: hypothetical protein U9O89_02465 [Thermoproteota archaeon]|nr:hypothetical protein [Thermoproteota archaeon]